MTIYWVLFLILACGALIKQQQIPERPNAPLLTFLVGLPTMLMIGLRWKIGPDWPAYEGIYRYAGLSSLAQIPAKDDPGFRLLCLVLQQVHAPFWVLNMVCGVVFVAGLLAFSKRQPNSWLAYLIAFPYLVIVVAMSGDRQSIALGLLLFALNAFEREQLYRFVGLILLAALFHGSALLTLPICLLSYSRDSVQRAALVLIAVGLGFYFFQDTFSTYARRYSLEQIQSTGVFYRIAMNTVPAIIFLLFQPRFALGEREAKLWRNFALFTLALIPLMAVIPSSTAIDRFLLYFFPLQFVVLGRAPLVFSADRQVAVILTLLVIIYVAGVQATFLNFGAFSRSYVPYRSILESRNAFDI